MQVYKTQTLARLELSDTGPYSILLNISAITLTFGEFIVPAIAKQTTEIKENNNMIQCSHLHI
jgi:hypothetical protein